MWEPQPLTTLRASKACRGETLLYLLHIRKIMQVAVFWLVTLLYSLVGGYQHFRASSYLHLAATKMEVACFSRNFGIHL
jgi:hypothetical protein